MQRFPDDSQDSVERLYAPHVLRCFPNYGRFWERFVGQRADPKSGTLRPYGLRYPGLMSRRQRNRLDRDYEVVCMQGYSVFVHLAGAHYQLGELRRALGLKDEARRHFRHWEAYDVGLLHLGTALSLGKGLLTTVGRLAGQGDLVERLVRHDLWAALDRAVRQPRNDVVHYSRRLHRRNPQTGDFEVLKEPYYESRRAWSQDLHLAVDDSKWTRADEQLDKNVADTETLLNEAWDWIMDALGGHLERLGVEVNYDEVQPQSRPLPLTPAVDTAQPWL